MKFTMHAALTLMVSQMAKEKAQSHEVVGMYPFERKGHGSQNI